MSKEQPFNCEVPDCPNWTSRIPHVCTKHFIEGWGRVESMPLPKQEGMVSETPVVDRMAKARAAKKAKAEGT